MREIDSMPKKGSWYSWSLRALVFSAVVWVVFQNIDEIQGYDFGFHWMTLCASFFSISAGYLCTVLIWISLTGSFGVRVSFLAAARAWFLSQLGKYVPGKVALLLVRFDAYQGHSKRKIIIATWIEYVVSLAGAAVVILVALMTTPGFVPIFVRWSAGIGAILFLGLLWPPVLSWYVNRGLMIFHKEPVEIFPPYGTMLRLVGAFVWVSLLHGLGFFLVIRSLFPVGSEYFLTIAGAYEAAAIIGLTAVFAPSGIGVREGVLFLVLPLFLPTPVVIVASILVRLVTTAVEFFLSLVFLLLERFFGQDCQCEKTAVKKI